MKKELPPLEAFERIKSHNYHNHSKKECLDIIETALKRLEQYETPARKEDVMSVAKRLTASEIIKKRKCLFKGLSEVTQEEFDLLMEVFEEIK